MLDFRPGVGGLERGGSGWGESVESGDIDNNKILELVEERYGAWQEKKEIEATTVKKFPEEGNKKAAPRI